MCGERWCVAASVQHIFSWRCFLMLATAVCAAVPDLAATVFSAAYSRQAAVEAMDDVAVEDMLPHI